MPIQAGFAADELGRGFPGLFIHDAFCPSIIPVYIDVVKSSGEMGAAGGFHLGIFVACQEQLIGLGLTDQWSF